ncbi:hypothetical protein FOCC_FOCC010910 [Frankliniella occidentalis]|nr:hypothetical protein FOCC_FOCC010910 [Frankliniella occidentalis]
MLSVLSSLSGPFPHLKARLHPKAQYFVEDFASRKEDLVKYFPCCEDEDGIENEFWKLAASSVKYLSDISGSLFDKEQQVWNPSNLGSVLDVGKEQAKKIEGIWDPMLYFGMWRSSFSWHTEHSDLYDLNYHHFGAAKTWYAISPNYSKVFEEFVPPLFRHITDSSDCEAFMNHRLTLLSPTILKKQKRMDPYLCDLNKEAPAVRFKKPIPTGSEKLTLEYITYYAGHSFMTAIDPFTDLASQDVTLQIQVGSNHMTISSEEFQKFQEFTEERQPAMKILSARYHGGGLMPEVTHTKNKLFLNFKKVTVEYDYPENVQNLLKHQAVMQKIKFEHIIWKGTEERNDFHLHKGKMFYPEMLDFDNFEELPFPLSPKYLGFTMASFVGVELNPEYLPLPPKDEKIQNTSFLYRLSKHMYGDAVVKYKAAMHQEGEVPEEIIRNTRSVCPICHRLILSFKLYIHFQKACYTSTKCSVNLHAGMSWCYLNQYSGRPVLGAPLIDAIFGSLSVLVFYLLMSVLTSFGFVVVKDFEKMPGTISFYISTFSGIKKV